MGLLMDKPTARESATILVPLESFLYLQEKSYSERTGKNQSDKARQRLTKNFRQFSYGGMKQLMDGSLGGCKGKPENAWEEGRWTSWSASDMAEILDEAGLPWKMGKDAEYITV